MACFLVPAAEAIVSTAVKHILQKKEASGKTGTPRLSLSRELGVLNKMLWGGSGLLAFEHLWHGEIAPFFPFLTAARTSDGTAEMLHEMATNGVGMAVLVTFVWGAWVVLERTKHHAKKRSEDKI